MEYLILNIKFQLCKLVIGASFLVFLNLMLALKYPGEIGLEQLLYLDAGIDVYIEFYVSNSESSYFADFKNDVHISKS